MLLLDFLALPGMLVLTSMTGGLGFLLLRRTTRSLAMTALIGAEQTGLALSRGEWKMPACRVCGTFLIMLCAFLWVAFLRPAR